MCIACTLGLYENHVESQDQSLEALHIGALSGTLPQGNGAVFELGDAAGGTSTGYSLLIDQSAYGTIGTGDGSDWYRVNLVAGQTYQFRLHGMGTNELGDPFLRLYNSSGGLLASNDDAGRATWSMSTDAAGVAFTSNDGFNNGFDSLIQFTATTTGTYYLEADAYNSTATGNYLLTAASHSSSGMLFTADEIAWQLINNGAAYFRDAPSRFNVGSDNTLTVNISGLTSAGQYLAQQALLAWTNVTGINFAFTTGAAEITFDDNQSGAFANTNISGSTITSAIVNISTGWLTTYGTTLNSYSFQTYIHEIGHALGLYHGGNYNAGGGAPVPYYANDSLVWSIMSYIDESANGGSFGNMQTPGIADIVAIQYLYGIVGPLIHSGNTTYGYGSNTGNTAIDNAVNAGSSMQFTIFDEAGTDTLNFANYSGTQTINLAGESVSSVLGGTFNLGIARNVIIENANGGSGSDTIYGNSVANVIRGNGGVDTIRGLAGNDTLYGDAGNDFLYGGVGFDKIAGGIGNDQIWGELGVDVLSGGADSDTIYGGDHNDSIYGNDGNDWLYGDAGFDKIAGGDGVDRLYGGLGVDLLFADAGNDFLYGEGQNDQLNGGAGNDWLDGGTGNDELTGGADHDTFYFTGAFGTDTIKDFNIASTTEKIDISTISTITSWTDLRNNHMSQVGANVEIVDGLGNKIILENRDINLLSEGDFVI